MLEPLPVLRPPDRPPSVYARHLPAATALEWLAAGWDDFRDRPWTSITFGLLLVLLSYGVLAGLNAAHLLYLALPAISGFLIVGPFFALGLYEKSRRRAAGQRFTLGDMVFVRPASGTQLAYAGLLLCLWVLFWLRAADLLYALFFGLTPFPGAREALLNVFSSPQGWGLIVVGGAVGGLFAAFAFAISAFSVPMLMAKKTDALTALGLSFTMTTHNLPVALAWAAIVVAGIALSVATALVGLVVIFPVLGHGTWHAYRAIGGKGG
ncbi:MAG TPA: DUF2189 domain-containing protein [Hyphomicrobiaceae bacterium]|nr:DUF2189 domain-containing protein [Hyphomicrobiaceae bacterium]